MFKNLIINLKIMKTKNILMAGIATSAILALSFSSVSAMNGQWGWQGQGKWQGMYSQQWNWSGSQQSGHENNPADLLEWIALQDLSDAEKDMLYYGYSEELLAHDMYMYFYELYGNQTFLNIANSESEHMTAVKVLLDRYELEIPTDYGELTDEFAALKAEGEQSLLKALEVWVKIELLDIDDIAETIRTTDNDDFKIIFTNIGWASFNHLRGFLNAINNAGLETEIDYSNYLSEEELDTKGGTLKTKMAEMLEAEGVELPEQASATYIQANCEQENSGTASQNWKANMMNNGQQWYQMANTNRYINSNVVSLKSRYKNSVETKYSPMIKSLNDESLNVLITKIDDLIEKVNTWDYSTEVKEKYTALLLILKELAVDNVDELDSEIQDLFN